MKPIDSLSDEELLALVRRAFALPDAPPQRVQDALELWRLRRPLPRPQPLLRRWVAVLSFDSWAGAPVAAVMRALPSEVRQLVFAANDCDIDLRITPATEAFAISGQLLGPDAEGSVELMALSHGSEEPLRRFVALDAQGEFRMDGVSSGAYRVTLRLGSDEIVFPPIDVGPPRDAGGS